MGCKCGLKIHAPRAISNDKKFKSTQICVWLLHGHLPRIRGRGDYYPLNRVCQRFTESYKNQESILGGLIEMAAETKRKLLHYRTVTFLRDPGRTLQDLIKESLAKLSPISSRKEDLQDNSEGESWSRFINTHRSAMGMEFGTLVLLTPGQKKLIIDTDLEKDEVNVSQFPPPQEREYLESILYYGIKNNHVILLQSLAMRARELENHLNWLLREAEVIGPENGVFLNNHVPDQLFDQISESDVKSIKIGTPILEETVDSKGEDNSASPSLHSAHKVSFTHQGMGLDILARLLPDNRLKNIDFGSMDHTSNVEVFVEVKYKRQTDDKSQQVLNKLAAELRHVSEEDIKVELKGIGTITGSQLVIKDYKSFTSHGGKLDIQDVFMQMNYWLEELLNKSMIRVSP